MVADARFGVTRPLRAALATGLYPLQWLAMQPVHALRFAGEYAMTLDQARSNADEASRKLASQALRAGQVEQLALENERLRKLLDLRDRIGTVGKAAQVIYEAADPYTRKVVIDKGLTQGVVLGSPVVDEAGVLGQVTLVNPLVSEVTLIIDRDLSIPVLNSRTGVRSVAFGDPSGAGGLELRFMGSNSDVRQGDLLTTSGVDGIYPPGLPVARVDRIERRAESAFARIYCSPLALVSGARHVMVLSPLKDQLPPRPVDPTPPAPAKKGGRK